MTVQPRMLSEGWNQEEITLPPYFIEKGWNLFLPKGTVSLLLSVITYILQGYNKHEIYELMELEEKELSLTPFDFTAPFAHKSEEARQVYLNIAKQESKIQSMLARSGLSYPQSVIDWIQLLIHLKIIHEVRQEDQVFLDVVIDPFPAPEEMLTLTVDERKKLEKYRLTQRMQKLSE